MSGKKKKTILQSSPGFVDRMGESYYELQGLYEKAQEIAMYYGFSPIDTPLLEAQGVFELGTGENTELATSQLYKVEKNEELHLTVRPEFTSAVMRAYLQHEMRSLPQPIMFYSYGAVLRHEGAWDVDRFRQHHQFDLEILGTEKPVADALAIHVTHTILKESGGKNLVVMVNSIGDKDSQESFQKALKVFYRKHQNQLPEADRQFVKTSVMRVLDSKHPKTIEINQMSPDPVAYLSKHSKKHFKKVLEHLEEIGIQYSIDKTLVRGFDYYDETVFEIREVVEKPEVEVVETPEGEEAAPAPEDIPLIVRTLAGGGRYNTLAQKLGSEHEVPSVGVAIGCERVMASSWWKKLTPRVLKKPKVYFIQVGFDAKLKSLAIIEILRKAKITVTHSISKDSLSSQLVDAKKSGADHVIIFGQREALDGTVMLRSTQKQSQRTVKIENLVDALKKK
jgi:histidyl-tRNA synthetase